MRTDNNKRQRLLVRACHLLPLFFNMRMRVHVRLKQTPAEKNYHYVTGGSRSHNRCQSMPIQFWLKSVNRYCYFSAKHTRTCARMCLLLFTFEWMLPINLLFWICQIRFFSLLVRVISQLSFIADRCLEIFARACSTHQCRFDIDNTHIQLCTISVWNAFRRNSYLFACFYVEKWNNIHMYYIYKYARICMCVCLQVDNDVWLRVIW